MQILRLIACSALFAASLPSLAQTPAKPVNLVVFADFDCPYSAQMFRTIQKLEATYPRQLHITWKQTPLPIHPESPLAHRAALAAGRQGKFEAMAELLYANQSHHDLPSLLSDARQLHLDLARFQRDLDSREVAAQLQSDLEESEALGVDQTPTFYIRGRNLIGMQAQETFDALIAGSIPAKAVALAPVSTTLPPPVDPTLSAALQNDPPAAVQGKASAPVTIVEFTDFQCPFCRSAVPAMEQLMQTRGAEVRWILRSYPLDFHPDSELANEAALAAGEQGKFWEMHDLIFTHQSAIKADNLRDYAQQLHLDMKAFDDALATHRFAGQIAADRALGVRAGVTGTPTFIVDGQLMTGARTLAELNQIVDAQLTPRAPGAPAPVIVLAAAETPERQIVGPTTAVPLTLTWYVDVRSPLAADQAELVHKLTARYDGRVRVLYRAFPVASHPDAQLGAAALLAAQKQDKFWPMFDTLAQRRDLLDREKLIAIAAVLDLDRTRFAADLEAATPEVNASLTEAGRRGIQGAPVLFLNKQRVDGLQREQFYTGILDKELARELAPPQAGTQ